MKLEYSKVRRLLNSYHFTKLLRILEGFRECVVFLLFYKNLSCPYHFYISLVNVKTNVKVTLVSNLVKQLYIVNFTFSFTFDINILAIEK